MTETSTTWKMSIDESLILGPLLLLRTSINFIAKLKPLEMMLHEYYIHGEKTASS